jgi:hypothetical protein
MRRGIRSGHILSLVVERREKGNNREGEAVLVGAGRGVVS